MAYSTGKLNKRVTVLVPCKPEDGEFGVNSAGAAYKPLRKVWATVDWSRGTKSIREGALDAYDVVIVYTRWHPYLRRECRLRIDGAVYAIESYHADRHENTIQITARELDS